MLYYNIVFTTNGVYMLRRTDIIAVSLVVAAWLANIVAMPYGHAWLNDLKLPAGMPPHWVFTPAWIGIYACVIIALAYALRMDHNRQYITTIWSLNLIANGAWGSLFFIAQSLWLAAFDAACIAITAIILVYAMSRYAWWASVLVVPYALWTMFATYLSVGIALLN